MPEARRRAAAEEAQDRKLWGKGSGKFRTTGTTAPRPSAAPNGSSRTRCAGTLTRVTQGVVAVRDNVKKKTILVRGPRGRYTAKPRK